MEASLPLGGACNWVLNPASCWALLSGWQAQALIRVGTDEPTHDPDWPAGTREYVALTSRVQWFEGPPFGGGQWTFQSRGNTDALRKAVEVFARIQSPVHWTRIRVSTQIQVVDERVKPAVPKP